MPRIRCSAKRWREVTDDEIKAAILSYFAAEFQNFGGDPLFQGPCDGDEEACNRAIELLDGATISITWPSDPVDPRLSCLCTAFAPREFRPGVDEPPY